jgi:hypothetical protein
LAASKQIGAAAIADRACVKLLAKLTQLTSGAMGTGPAHPCYRCCAFFGQSAVISESQSVNLLSRPASLDQQGDAVMSLAAALVSGDAKVVELADQVTENESRRGAEASHEKARQTEAMGADCWIGC